MPTLPQAAVPAGAGRSDIHLHVQTERAGRIKGESRDSAHADEIQVLGWNWALQASPGVGSTRQRARRNYTALSVLKKIDAATTPLMSALATNDRVTEARLTMRRAGGGATDYLTITLRKAHVEKVEHTVEADGDTLERVDFVFAEVEVDYRPQDAAGRAGGSFTFADELMGDT